MLFRSGEPTNEDLDAVVAKWWRTMTAIASFDEKLDLLLRSVRVGTIRRPGDKGLSTKSLAYRRDESYD